MSEIEMPRHSITDLPGFASGIIPDRPTLALRFATQQEMTTMIDSYVMDARPETAQVLAAPVAQAIEQVSLTKRCDATAIPSMDHPLSRI
jgi:hypothetical protein